jgi:hypothetical protein
LRFDIGDVLRASGFAIAILNAPPKRLRDLCFAASNCFLGTNYLLNTCPWALSLAI